MKIGLDTAPASHAECYTRHLASILRNHAPEHEYLDGDRVGAGCDLYHGFGPGVPLGIYLRGIPTVVTLPDLRFLHDLQVASPLGRRIRLAYYRRVLRGVGRLVTVGAGARDEVIGVLGIAPERVEAVVELGAAMPRRPLLDGKLEHVRRKYGLPRRFVLAVGDAESRCNYKAVFDALLRADRPEGLVVCGRHTAAADRLLAYLRERHLAGRVDFIYEAGEDDRAALFRLARAFVCLHEAGAAPSVGPLVEAMRAGVPMLLNDIPALRDAAGDAAVYVSAADPEAVAKALARLLGDEELRRDMGERARRRAEAYSECAVARRMAAIYASL